MEDNEQRPDGLASAELDERIKIPDFFSKEESEEKPETSTEEETDKENGPTGPTGTNKTNEKEQAGGTAKDSTSPTGPTGPTDDIEKEKEKENEIEELSDTLTDADLGPDSKSGEKPIVDYNEIAKEFEIELGNNKKEDFIQAIKSKIQESTTKVELDLSKYDDYTQKAIKFIDKGGKVSDLINPLSEYYKFLAMSPEDKVRASLINQGIKEDEIDEKLLDLQDKGKFESTVENINQSVNNAILKKQEDLINEENNRKIDLDNKDHVLTKQENEKLIESVKKIDTFMGLKVSDELRNSVIQRIENGSFHDDLNNPDATIRAYLNVKLGSTIISRFEKRLEQEKKESYNAGLAKGKEGLHETRPKLTVGGALTKGEDINDEEGPLGPMRGFGKHVRIPGTQ